MQDLHGDSIPGVDTKDANIASFGRRAMQRGTERAKELGAAAQRGAQKIGRTATALVDTREKQVAAYTALGVAFVVGFVSGLFASRAGD
jgi:hypothetical protein